MQGYLAGGDALHVELVALRPLHLVFGFTVGAEDDALDFFPQSRGSDYTHSTLTVLTSEDSLHMPSLSSWEEPATEILRQCAAGSAAGCNPCCGTSCVPRVSGSIFMR